MIQINQCRIRVEKDSKEEHQRAICRLLHIKPEQLFSFKIAKKSLDARKKPDLFFSYTFLCEVANERGVLQKNGREKRVSRYQMPIEFEKTLPVSQNGKNIIIIGAGPAGLFAAYTLVLCGWKPIVIERGCKIEERIKHIEEFWSSGKIRTDSNISFGEGGAGTFSDGKLNTGVKDKSGRLSFILRTFVSMGAPEEILYESKPHIGTDLLRTVITNLRIEIERLGGRFEFQTTFLRPLYSEGSITGAEILRQKDGQRMILECDHCILAPGHSARDTFSELYQQGVNMEPKPFAVGVRVEHPQEWIDWSQYGRERGNLPAADYKVTARTANGRNVYSFCMCPGGFVVNASSADHELVVNGMSNHSRDEKNANSAVIVNVMPEDFPEQGPLAGVSFQKCLEKQAWEAGHGRIPVQRFQDFQKNCSSDAFGVVTPNTKGGTILSNVRKILPEFAAEAICDGMEQFGKKIKGFDHPDVLMLGIETRTSSPVRILREKDLQSNIRGLYPCGEGAGYAGGIMSAAMDGCKVAAVIAASC